MYHSIFIILPFTDNKNIFLLLTERKLKAIRKKNKVVENLAAYRADCIHRLMREGCDLDPVIGDTEDEKLLQDEQE